MTELRLEIQTDDGYKQLYIEDDTSIEIECASPLWNDQGMFSQTFELPIEPNRHVLGNVDDIRGHSIYKLLWGKRFRLWVGGLLFQTGVIHLDSEIDINDGVVEIELAGANKEFDDRLDGVSARDVIVLDENKVPGKYEYAAYSESNKGGYVQIGKALAEKDDVNVEMYLTELSEVSNVTNEIQTIQSTISNYNPQIVFPRLIDAHDSLTYDFVNTTEGYPAAAYCNVQTCYQKYVRTSDSWEKERGYSVGSAARVHSAPCFYVMYWLERLLSNVGIVVKENRLLDEKDMCYLAFMNTKVGYKSGEKIGEGKSGTFDSYWYGDKCGFKISRMIGDDGSSPMIACLDKKITINGTDYTYKSNFIRLVLNKSDAFEPISVGLYNAYATGDNFPDTDASSIIDGLKNGFGCRFIFDSNVGSVRIVFIRDVLRQTTTTVLDCIVSDAYKRENHIKGFRLKYSASNSKSKQNAITKKDKEYTGESDSGEDTTYNYNDYRDVIHIKGLRSKEDSADIKEYGETAVNLWPYDAKAYYNSSNGELYRIKVDSDAKTAATLYPSLFEVGGYGDVEIGDCSDDDFVEEVEIGFNPLIPNDINYDKVKKLYSSSDSSVTDSTETSNSVGSVLQENVENSTTDIIEANYATFVDAEIHHVLDSSGAETMTDEVVVYDTAIASYNVKDKTERLVTKTVSVPVQYKIEAIESWKLDGSASNPYDGVDFGFTLGILRQSKTGGGMSLYNEDYDSEGRNHSRVQFIPSGSGQFTSDSVDQYGHILCAHAGDGDEDGTVKDSEVTTGISLKLKAEKMNPYWKEWYKNGREGTYKYQSFTEDSTGYFVIDEDKPNNHIGRRGLYDKFYREYAYWVINRRIAIFTIPRGGIGLIQLMGIDYTKKYSIHGYSGFINKINYSIDNDGLGDVEIEMYYL